MFLMFEKWTLVNRRILLPIKISWESGNLPPWWRYCYNTVGDGIPEFSIPILMKEWRDLSSQDVVPHRMDSTASGVSMHLMPTCMMIDSLVWEVDYGRWVTTAFCRWQPQSIDGKRMNEMAIKWAALRWMVSRFDWWCSCTHPANAKYSIMTWLVPCNISS